MSKPSPTIVVLGASGLIGYAVSHCLMREGFNVVPVARRFSDAQRAQFGNAAIQCPVVDIDADDLARFLSGHRADLVVNCIGILQDHARASTADVHGAFVGRLVAALSRTDDPALLVHVSIPGKEIDDNTPFSVTKRAAERTIAASGIPSIVLRPGFVLAQAAYGGSALLRALAALPVALPVQEREAPFAFTYVDDIARTIAFAATRWQAGKRDWRESWDVMHPQALTVGLLLAALRQHLGGPRWQVQVPSWMLRVGARLGDLVSVLGWMPPIRSTALMEMRRGVAGDPAAWMSATGIEPVSLAQALRLTPATVQEKWFARLYLAKALAICALVIFWCLSGLIALTVAFTQATAILSAAGFPLVLAQTITIVSSVADILVGLAIARRSTCRRGLVAGISLSLFYMAGAALFTPQIWIEPLGALVKTGPAIVLMVTMLAILEDR